MKTMIQQGLTYGRKIVGKGCVVGDETPAFGFGLLGLEKVVDAEDNGFI